MPCRSDYPPEFYSPTRRNKKLNLTAKLICYVCAELEQPAPAWVVVEAEADCATKGELTPTLCSLIKSLNKEQFEKIVYNARNKTSRKLADWWEKHLEVDRQRELLEKEIAKKEKLRKQALAKLSKQERAVLGI